MAVSPGANSSPATMMSTTPPISSTVSQNWVAAPWRMPSQLTAVSTTTAAAAYAADDHAPVPKIWAM